LEYAAKDYHQDEQVPTSGLHFHLRDSGDFVLPKLAVTRVIAPGTTAEASISLGSRPGGFSPYTDKPPLIPYSAEHTAAFEAGVTSESGHRTASLTARVFAYEVRNYQIEQSFSATDYLVATAPRARSLGAEIGVQIRPLPGWSLDAVAGITDATLLSFKDPVTGESYAGNRAPYVPAATADLGAGYRAARGFFGRADLVAKGRTFYTESETPLYAQGPYALLNARAGYEAGRWRLTVYADNITGTNYYAQIIPGVNSGAPGTPRTVGSELAVKF
jgi:iron complex outermembrane receptor protein